MKLIKLGFIGRTLSKIFQALPPKARSWLVSVGYLGSYASTDPQRLFLEGLNVLNATADQALAYNLTKLIAQCRQLERNNATARAIIEGWKADVIGTGIGVEPDTGDTDLNNRIRPLWNAWCECATPDGRTLWELQAQALSECCTAGALLWREVSLPSRLSSGQLPICFAALEVEWLTTYPLGPVGSGSSFVRGIELDPWGRPLNYHIMDYNQMNTLGIGTGYGGPGEVVPAGQIIHGYEQRRPRQSHGEPLLAPAIERLYQTGRLVDTELKAANNTSAIAVAITSEYQPDITAPNIAAAQNAANFSLGAASAPVNDIPAGSLVRLFPGEDVKTIQNNRPSQLIKDFRGMLRGDEAAATRSSQQWLDRDSSRANYSSMRMDELLTERVRGPVQNILGRFVASQPYERVLPWILLKLGVQIPANVEARARMFSHKLMPDRPKYVDPTKDGQAAVYLIDHGLSTKQEEAANRGRDYEKIRERLQIEQVEQDADTVNRIASLQKAINQAKKKDPTLNVNWSQIMAIGGAATAPGAFLEGSAATDLAAGGGQPSDTSKQPAPAGQEN